MPDDVILRPYRADDLEPALMLWQRAWDATKLEVDFAERLQWWRERWSGELVPNNTIIVAERSGRMVGFLVIDPDAGRLDQVVVDPPFWGAGIADRLIEEAKRLSPAGIRVDVKQSNTRGVQRYERAGFVRTSEGTNPNSGVLVWVYEWKPSH